MLVTLRHRIRLTAVAAIMALAGICAAQAQSVAFTFDDGPQLEDTPLMSPQQRNQAMLDALAAHKVSAALFVTCDFGATMPAGYALAKAWRCRPCAGQPHDDASGFEFSQSDVGAVPA